MALVRSLQNPFFRWEAVERSMPMLLLQSYVNSAEVPGNAKLVQLHPRLEPNPNALPLREVLVVPNA